jgi:hypothetical protein
VQELLVVQIGEMIISSQRSAVVEAFPRVGHGRRFVFHVGVERVDAIATSVALDSSLFEANHQSIESGRYVQVVLTSNQTHGQ